MTAKRLASRLSEMESLSSPAVSASPLEPAPAEPLPALSHSQPANCKGPGNGDDLRAVLTGLTVGLGHGLMKVAEGRGMSSMHEKTWRAHLTAIISQTAHVKQSILQQACDKVEEYYRREEPDGVLNVDVSYDGTWAKRGHTLKIGAGAIIEVMTSLVIDVHVMSTYCQLCASVGERLRRDNDREYEEWLQGHQESSLCTRKYKGSAGGMEVRGALTMWRRSLEHVMRYATFIGDGDTKTLAALNEDKPYGAILVVKEECVNPQPSGKYSLTQ
ncbi:hypothetical protein PoB_001205600 [Plakobranchus ocellatus]|uniref:Mutator-like transposase domain-containing protein n=1 Tax=Plakobranchus ocellatus TaxID=259542 RepID=A0AAV3YE10_9GAST|nr:hypothetical protein PoB_001205600 [Plakobranchus ocellatus]